MRKIIILYRRNFLKAELILSFIIAIIIIGLIDYVMLWSRDDIISWISQNKADVYPLVASIGGTLLGFVVTGVSVLIAFTESGKLDLLKKSEHYKTMYAVYFNTIKYLAIVTGVAFIGLMVDGYWAIPLLYIIIWAVIISLLRMWRCVWILENIVEISMNQNAQDGD